jgi:hypothetical protein
MIQQKYLELNILIAQRKGLPGLLQQQIIRSDEDTMLAKLCADFLNEQIQTICQKKNPPVWIPYYNYLANALPSNKGTDSRTTKRIFSLLNIIPLAKAHLRDKLVYDVETLAIAAIEDLDETLSITNNITGIPTFKMKFFKEIFYPLEKSKGEPDKSGAKQETMIAVTTRQLCDYYRKVYNKTTSSDNLKKTFLTELLNSGIIDEEPSVIDQRQHIYRSLIDIEDDKEDKENYRYYTNIKPIDNILSAYHIRTPNNFQGIPQKWLLLEILGLLNYRIGIEQIAVISHSTGERMSMVSLCEKYEKNTTLNRYFSMPKFANFRSEIFGTMKYLGIMRQKIDEKLSNEDGFVYFRQFDESKDEKTSSKGVKFDDKDDIPKESWVAKTITENNNRSKHPAELPPITCTYCNQSFKSTEITAHMDKCAADAIAEYERRKADGV